MQNNFFFGKRVLVTGGNGFIGSHLIKRLIGKGAIVAAFTRAESDVWRLEATIKDCVLFRGDIRSKENIDSVINKVKPDYIFHLAAYGVDSRQNEYTAAIDSNVQGTLNVIYSAIKNECRKVINIGSSMQYGNKKGPITEESSYTPVNIYGSSKAAATILAHQIASEKKLDIVTIVPFGIFGEYESSYRLFPHIILSILGKKDLKLTMGEQYRDYCYIDNIIDGLLICCENEKIRNEVFNIGSGEIYTLRHFTELIVRETGTDMIPQYGAIPYRENDLWCPKPDITKIKITLGWEPRISLDEGLKRTVEWFSHNYESYMQKGR